MESLRILKSLPTPTLQTIALDVSASLRGFTPWPEGITRPEAEQFLADVRGELARRSPR